MRPKKLIASIGVLCLAAVGLSACSSSNSSSKDKQEITWMDAAEIPTMDISKATDNTSFNQLNNVMEGLYRLGKDEKIENALATKTQVSQNGKKWVFTLRKSKWSDGTPLTAKDFVYSWRRTVNPATGSQYAYLFEGIKNATDITAGKKPVSSLGVKADGKYKLVVTLDKQVPYFKLLMGFPLFFPQQEKMVKSAGSKYGTASKYVAYNGPFVQTGWSGANLSWKLKKNKNYWDKKAVKLNTINYSVQKTTSTAYNMYQSNMLDATKLDAEQSKHLKEDPGYTVRNSASTFYLQYNQAKLKALRNTNLRRAISMAVNRQSLVKILGGGNTAANSLTAKNLAKVDGVDFSSTVSDNGYDAYNPTAAKKLFKQALKELGTKSISLTILSDDTDVAKKTTETLQSQLESTLPGMNIKTQNVPFKTRLSRSTAGDFDIVVSAWGADFADPISFDDLFTSNNANNNGKWKNKEYDQLIEASKNTTDQKQRWKDLRQAESLLLDQQGVSPLYYQGEAWLVRPDIKGIIYNSAGANYNFKNAYVAKN
ncbi:peptide ABC transporter substrate-binding protein [Lactobacillus sp. PV037]|uniref:peptide ABC transporter substrate-binding protein n=1 Tax=Lactobacillus sp. PV037 TaxID=2594496 RepID=UPI00224033FE|nr:peptide ABC transporter substrate-binding protein [Lactobacillus sp. PV037]QNQ84197.1 peptide ABC transporter substrate-binding protein [Lactobacillus sp. PV037]